MQNGVHNHGRTTAWHYAAVATEDATVVRILHKLWYEVNRRRVAWSVICGQLRAPGSRGPLMTDGIEVNRYTCLGSNSNSMEMGATPLANDLGKDHGVISRGAVFTLRSAEINLRSAE